MSWSGGGEADEQSGEVHAIFFNNLTVAEGSAEWRGVFLSPVLDIAMCLLKSRRETGAVQEPEEIVAIGLVWEPFFKDSCSQMC